MANTTITVTAKSEIDGCAVERTITISREEGLDNWLQIEKSIQLIRTMAEKDILHTREKKA